MGVQEEQERRRELLLRAFEAYSDPEQALAAAVRMEQFIIAGQGSREKPPEATQPVARPSSEGPRKICNRPRWTAADDTHLRRLWQDELTVEQTAQELHRTPASIYARVRILDLSSSKHDARKGKRKVKLPNPGRRPRTTDSEDVKDFDAVGIDSVVHFLRTRDFSVVQTKDDCYDLDGRKILTAQELFERANKVRAQLGRPAWAALGNGSGLEGAQESKN